MYCNVLFNIIRPKKGHKKHIKTFYARTNQSLLSMSQVQQQGLNIGTENSQVQVAETTFQQSRVDSTQIPQTGRSLLPTPTPNRTTYIYGFGSVDKLII